MMKQKGRIRCITTVAGLTATVMLFTLSASPAWAEREQGCQAGMGMNSHGHGHDMHSGWGHGMRGMKPHNAAEHFLKMGQYLNLTTDQVKQLTKLRDDYIEKYATTEEQLKVANEDLGRALYGDSVDMNAVNALFEKIGKMDGQLWHAYAQQLHDIKAMLTTEQKQSLNAMWHDGHHGMHRDMPMDRDDMPMKKGIGM